MTIMLSRKKKTPPRKPNDSERDYWREVKEGVEEMVWKDETLLKQYVHLRLPRGFKYTPENKALLNYLVDLTLSGKEEWVYVYGECGTGKTTILKVFAKIWKVKVANAHKLAEIVQDKHLQGPLYIDDFGAEREPQYAKANAAGALGAFVEERFYREERTIITSNLNLKEVEQRYGKRVLSRLRSGYVYELKGPDYRVKESG